MSESQERSEKKSQELFQCKVCKDYKEAEMFGVDKRAKSGRLSYCKNCRGKSGWGRKKYAKTE